MSTNDVPGFNPDNKDELAMGCWAEHDDGSLIFVESNETGRVIYSMFDVSKKPPIEYRDAMPEDTFKKRFTWDSVNEKWTWHDKTPFPWDRIIQAGATDGGRYATADDLMTAAERVAESLKLRGAQVASDIRHRAAHTRSRVTSIMDKVSRALGELRK